MLPGTATGAHDVCVKPEGLLRPAIASQPIEAFVHHTLLLGRVGEVMALLEDQLACSAAVAFVAFVKRHSHSPHLQRWGMVIGFGLVEGDAFAK